MKIQYYTKEVYGNTLNYIANPHQAQFFYQLTGKKTFSREDMIALHDLTGVMFERVFEPAYVNKKGQVVNY